MLLSGTSAPKICTSLSDNVLSTDGFCYLSAGAACLLWSMTRWIDGIVATQVTAAVGMHCYTCSTGTDGYISARTVALHELMASGLWPQAAQAARCLPVAASLMSSAHAEPASLVHHSNATEHICLMQVKSGFCLVNTVEDCVADIVVKGVMGRRSCIHHS